MSSASPERVPASLVSSTGFRIALINTALLIVTMAAAATAAWIATRDLAAADVHDRIAIEVRAIRVEAAQEGLAAAAEAVTSRAERPGALKYRLVDASGRRVAGNLSVGELPPGWSRLTSPAGGTDGDRRGTMLVRTERLAGGGSLSIGDDLTRSEAMRDAIFRSIAIWGGAAVALGLALGLWLTGSALRRMDAVVETVAAVGRGDLAARTPVSGHRDDIDTLARGVNAMLDHIGLLVQALRRVSADVAHELRTPLTHVRQRLERAAAAPDAETRAAELDAANLAMDQSLRLFDAMLRLAEIDGGHSRSRFASVDLAEVVDRVADAYRPEVEASGRRLEVAAVPGAVVRGDVDLISQALANLVENSLKHGDSGSRVCITLARRAGKISLMVADDGPGVSELAIPLITEAFYRVDRARATPGAGIGLAIVAAIARLHEARLHIGNDAEGFGVRLEFAAE